MTPARSADHLRKNGQQVAGDIDATVSAAQQLFAEREDLWRPIAIGLAAWVDLARRGQQDDESAKRLGVAEKALATATDEIRSARFEPIATQAKALWAALRLESNVNLEAVALSGKGNPAPSGSDRDRRRHEWAGSWSGQPGRGELSGPVLVLSAGDVARESLWVHRHR